MQKNWRLVPVATRRALPDTIMLMVQRNKNTASRLSNQPGFPSKKAGKSQ
jgi:hypothetical protein